MKIKETIQGIFEGVFIIFTCSVLVMSIYMYIYGVRVVLVRDIAALFVISLITSTMGFITESNNEHPSQLEMFIRYAILLVMVNVVGLAVGTYMRWVVWSIPRSVVHLLIISTIIYFAVIISIYLQSKKLADDLNKKLQERYMRDE